MVESPVASGLNFTDMLVKARFQVCPFDSSCNEYNPRAVIVVRPGVELHRGVENMVDAVDSHRRRLADQVEDTFNAQQILAPLVAPGRAMGGKRPMTVAARR